MFSTQDHVKVDNEVIFMLVPHIVRAQESDPLGGQSIGTGSGDVIELQMDGTQAQK